MPNNKPKGSPSQAPRSAAMPAHCQPTRLACLAMHTATTAHCRPTISAMPALFSSKHGRQCPLISSQNAQQCLLAADQHGRQYALPISNRQPTNPRGNAFSAMLSFSANLRKLKCLAVAKQHARQCLQIAYQRAPMTAQFRPMLGKGRPGHTPPLIYAIWAFLEMPGGNIAHAWGVIMGFFEKR